MAMPFLRPLLALVFLLLLFIPAVSAADDGEHGVMRPSADEIARWNSAYSDSPPVSISAKSLTDARSTTGSRDLLPLLNYTPNERNQGRVGNCWAWAGTGVLEVALSVEKGIRDRLSIEYLDANYRPASSDTRWAGDGGLLTHFTDFYSETGMAVPWSNPNADYRDGVEWCDQHGRSLVPAYAIGTEPNYRIESIAAERIPTRHIGREAAIANIKAVLDENRAVWFAFYFPNRTALFAYYDHWDDVPETGPAWDPDPWMFTEYNESSGAGHAVLCVGYNDTDPANRYWVMLNSWGTTPGRPNGLFRVSMDIDYDASLYLFDQDCAAMLWMTEDVAFAASPTPTPRPIDALPYTITEPGVYTLTRDWTDLQSSRALDIRASDVVVNGNGHRVVSTSGTGQYGVLAYRSGGLSNVTVRDLVLSDWDEGVALYDVDGGAVTGCTITNSHFGGIALDGGTANIRVATSTLSKNGMGLFLRGTTGTVVEHNQITDSGTTGISLYSSSGNRIADNRLSNNQNVLLQGTIGANVWNGTKTVGTNIVGGPYTGGNYWGTPSRKGWSDTAYDTDRDGIGDEPYTIAGNGANVDRLPLVNYAIPAPSVVPGGQDRPNDLDGDRLFEDVNGNRRFDFADITLLFSELSWIGANEPVQLFDFNGNGRCDFGDVVSLFNLL
jgi:parallel beta-helix repeat protein